MSGMHHLAALVAALGCISCAEPVPPLPQRAPVIASAPLDLPSQSCAAADNQACDSRNAEIFAMRPPRLDGRYDFGHAPPRHDLAEVADGRPLPSPAAAPHCGFHLLNKVVVPFCARGAN
jgi:hypothetical protein